MSEWTSAKEGLPRYGLPVWVVYGGVVQHVAYARDIGEWRPLHDDQSDSMPESFVSHWMRIPEPPPKE